MDFSPPFFLLLVPLILIPIFASRRRGAHIPLMGIALPMSPRRGYLMRASLLLAAGFLAAGIVAPPNPIAKTVIVRSQTECARDILAIVDISGSMQDAFKSAPEDEAPDKFDIALSSLHTFAANRSGDCFGIVIFSGPGSNSFAAGSTRYASLINDGVRDPDQLILSLEDGLSGPRGTKALHQFVSGTRISDGILVAEEFFADTATSDAHVAILISDLGNEEGDNAKTIEAITRLIANDVRFYIFGVDVLGGSSLPGTLQSFARENNIPFRAIGHEQDFTEAYRFVDDLEPAPRPIYEKHYVTLNVPNRGLLVAALFASMPWVFLRLTKRRIP